MSNDFLSHCESLPFTQLIFGNALQSCSCILRQYCQYIDGLGTESAEKIVCIVASVFLLAHVIIYIHILEAAEV